MYTPKYHNRGFIDWPFFPLYFKFIKWIGQVTSKFKLKQKYIKWKGFHDRVIIFEYTEHKSFPQQGHFILNICINNNNNNNQLKRPCDVAEYS